MKPAAFAAALLFCAALPAAAQAPETTVLGRYRTTNTGQPIPGPSGPVEVTVSRVTIPAGTSLPVHKHPFQRLAYVESGRIRVSNLDTGASIEFKPGDTIVEARDQWHTGTALGDTPVVLLVIDQTPPGAANTVRKEP
ncbi:MAG TPA: cupin domain-containing protein [Caulobacter sp.]|nr:cupin domain-containing protein [Caulobacter sp.]